MPWSASRITQGIIVEGELTIGISLGDTFQEIEATTDLIEEFDPSERFCEGLSCIYTARDAGSEVLGTVLVGFRLDNAATYLMQSLCSRYLKIGKQQKAYHYAI